MGRHQFEFLVKEGLEAQHFLLDVGCGSLRGGVHFIDYLDPARYYGVDIDERLLEAGRAELRAAGLVDKEHTLRQTDSFNLDFGRSFDFGLAQSVFTHLPLNSIQRGLLNVQHVLAPSGRFFATFFLNPHGKSHTGEVVHQARPGLAPITTYMDRDPYHYPVSAFEWACAETELDVEYIGDWHHPRGQHMLLFRHRSR